MDCPIDPSLKELTTEGLTLEEFAEMERVIDQLEVWWELRIYERIILEDPQGPIQKKEGDFQGIYEMVDE